MQPFLLPGTSHIEHWYDLKFSEFESCSITFKPDSEGRISHFCVVRPCGGRALANLLFNVMAEANWVIFSPSGDLLLIANPGTASHLPPGMVESLGPLVVASDRDSFFEALV
ncbi:MAG TPA: hypothetical protein VG733_16145 [Chthoniobacteraceae bacterium]|nr:hypothetical protein [Chthoniobacteraceae bacterium]